MTVLEILLCVLCAICIYVTVIVYRIMELQGRRLKDMHEFNMYNSTRLTLTRRELKMSDEPEMKKVFKVSFIDHKGTVYQSEADDFYSARDEAVRLSRENPQPKLTFKTSNPEFEELIDKFNNQP